MTPIAKADPGAATQPATNPVPPPQAGDQNTGFDLYVVPAGVTNWKLDGEARTDRLPSRIRGISPGSHKVQIEPPAGFMSQDQQVAVEAGKAPKVEIVLQPMTGITGLFESTPPDATITLMYDGKRDVLKGSPAKAPLDPRISYTVLFEKPGYVSFNKPIQFTGGLEERRSSSTSRRSPAAPRSRSRNPPHEPATGPVTQIKNTPVEPKHTPVEPKHVDTVPKETLPLPKEKPPVEPPTPKEKPPVEPAVAKGEGTLQLGSKPVCDIFIDGSSSGLHTPQREIKLSAGNHRITLVNNEFGIKESFSVSIKPGEPTKMVKDFSDKLPK